VTRFGLRYDLRRLADGPSHAELYAACIEQCAWGDRLGFSTIMISEHHIAPSGYMPAPIVLGGAIAARTRNVRIRISSLVAPLHNPLRLAEDLAVLDVISNGRLEPVLSGGYVGDEFEALGTSLAARADYMEEIVPFLRRAWAGETVAWRDGPPVRISTLPVQRPHVPIWMGGASKAAARRAARHADVFQPARAELYAEYLAELARLGKPAPAPGPRQMMAWVAEDPDAFWAKFAPYALNENNEYGRWWARWNAWNGYVETADADELKAARRYPVYTPDELVTAARALGPDGFVMLHPMSGGLDPDVAWQSLELVERQVLPALAGA
jgi:alkanesulfonate monooxygenase SsuD/methylene tetrahydromethanopterin reductase-like flavin-dependent oxidoreductase (luciferase family)